MRLAIHSSPRSYSDRWIKYCVAKKIDHKIVNAYGSTIMDDLNDCDGFLWHWQHNEPEALLFASKLIAAVEEMGLTVFPDTNTCWHYDDKVAQKYLLESIDAPLAPVWVFYDKSSALDWARSAEFPKVWKLRRGAGSSQVKLMRSLEDATKFINRAFGRGWVPVERATSDVAIRFKNTGSLRGAIDLIKRAPKGFLRLAWRRKLVAPERGYFYAQEFVPENKFDTRVTIIGDRAFGFRRMVRPDDFRASGSGRIDYDSSVVDQECVRIAFQVAQHLRTQSLAFDFVHTPDGTPLIVEISYAYLPGAIHSCSGHWDPDLNWVDGAIWPEDAMIDDLIALIQVNSGQ
jgi:glutathione synthase/RimK-type ligase-like ATP-grasp enzyme